MTGRPSASTDRLEFPNAEAAVGEDPARFLDVSTIEDLRLARARIRGIDDLERLEVWRAIERRIATVRNREPREKVLEWLDEREAVLEEIGERPDRLEDQERRDPEPTESNVEWVDRDGSRSAAVSYSRPFGPVGERSAQDAETPSSERGVATDGGRDS